MAAEAKVRHALDLFASALPRTRYVYCARPGRRGVQGHEVPRSADPDDGDWASPPSRRRGA